jgi:hypothetical protein
MNLPHPVPLSLALVATLACRLPGKREEQREHARAGTAEVTATATNSCPSFASSEVAISLDSIGPIPLRSGLGVAGKVCPGFRRARGELESGNRVVDWTFNVNGVPVTAMQSLGTATDTLKPAETWTVQSTTRSAILLPGKVPLPRTWGELRKHYNGPARLEISELGPMANICGLPGLTFSLSFSYGPADIGTMTADGIPATALIGSIIITPADTNTSC